MNQYGPDGSVTYSKSKGSWYTDPSSGQRYYIPQYNQHTTLSEAQRAIKDQSDAAQLNLASLANQQSSFLQDYMAEPFSYTPGEHEEWAMGLYDAINSDRIGRDSENLRSRLANQGIKAGSDAYMDEMDAFRTGNMNAQNRFLLDSYGQGFQTAQATRNQPINEITALLSGSQVSMPQFGAGTNQPSVPTVDYAGLVNENYNQRLGAYNTQMAQRNQLLGGLFGLGGAIISDKRKKTDIKPVGEVKGHKVYEYRYKGDLDDGHKHIGVMAQEAEKKKPDAVVTYSDGTKAVKYGQLFGVAA